jgi:hypothetical protein
VTWASVADLKTFLRWDADTSEGDAALQRQLDSACSVIEGIKGRIGADVVTNEPQPVERLGLVFVGEHPIASVEQVRAVNSDGTFRVLPQANPAGGVLAGWSVRSLGGVIEVPLCYGGTGGVEIGDTVLVDYTAGLAVVPQNYTDAAIELAAFLWNSSQNNDEGGRTGSYGTDQDWPARASGGIGAYALPFRVRELLGLYGAAVKSSVMVR